MAVIRTPRAQRLGPTVAGTRPMGGGGGGGGGPQVRPMGPRPADSGAGGQGWGTTGATSGWKPEDPDGGGGSSSGYYNYLIRQQELELDKAKAAAAREGAKRQAEYLQGLLGQGPSKDVLDAIEAQRAAGAAQIQAQAAKLLSELNTRKTQATNVTGTAFDNLRTYLAGNAPTAYTQALRAVPEVTQTALGQYMAGQGVSPAVAQEAAQLANVQAAGGASNYNQLLNVLAARETATQQSRLAEEQMARASAIRALESLYGAGTYQVEQQQLDALANVLAQANAARLAAQQQATERDIAIQNALGQLYATGNVPLPAQPGTSAALTPIQQLQQLTTNASINNPALARRVQAAVAANPNATLAQIQRQFPQLGKTIARRMA